MGDDWRKGLRVVGAVERVGLRDGLRRGTPLVFTLVVGCGIGDCPPLTSRALGNLPPVLSRTGLFTSVAPALQPRLTLASGVLPYQPRFELWSDGATKNRWVSLPEGGRIDTSDMNDWRFPEGTRIWKEFVRDDQVLETRFMYKAGPTDDDWAAGAYVWNDGKTDATLSLGGANNVAGTSHDVPAASACWGCHGGTQGRVLGIAAVQLPEEDASTSEAGGQGVTLASLTREGRLSTLPAGPVRLPGSPLDQQALGYLHANCGSCHNQARPPSGELRCYDPRRDVDLSLRVERLGTVEQTPAYRTALGKSLIPSEPDDSSLVTRCERRYFRHMPPLGTEEVDVAGTELLRRWVSSLRPISPE